MGKHIKQIKIVWLFSLFAVVLLFVGCGGQSSQSGSEKGAEGVSGTAISGGAVSGNAVSVSGSAVSGSAIQEQTWESEIADKKELFKRTKKQPYANDYHLFEGDKLEGIYQYSLTGKKEKFYETGWLSCPDVLWVDSECILYYCDYDDGDTPSRLYYAPLAGGKGKKQILLNQKMVLAEPGEFNSFVAKRGDDVYFVREQKLCKVNIKTKKLEKLKLGQSKYVSVLNDFNGQPCIREDKAYLVADDNNFYEFDLKQCAARKIGRKLCKDYYDKKPNIAVDEHYMYFGMEPDEGGSDEIVKVSLDTGERTVLVTTDEVEELVKKYGVGKTAKYITGRVVKWGDKIYFVLEVTYASDDWHLLYEEEHLVFHCLAEDGSEIIFEKEMYELEKKVIKPYLEDDMDSTWKIRNGSVVGVLGENQFAIKCETGGQEYFWDDEVIEGETDTRFILYDTKTNRAKQMKEGTAEYGLMRASGYEVFEEYDGAHS